MNPLIFSLICLILVAISANFLSLIKENKTLLYISIIPCIYIVIYGFYLILGPIDLYGDGTSNFFGLIRWPLAGRSWHFGPAEGQRVGRPSGRPLYMISA